MSGIGQLAGYSGLRHQDGRANFFIHAQQLLRDCAIEFAGGQPDSARAIAGVDLIPVAGPGSLQSLNGEPFDGGVIVERIGIE